MTGSCGGRRHILADTLSSLQPRSLDPTSQLPEEPPHGAIIGGHPSDGAAIGPEDCTVVFRGNRCLLVECAERTAGGIPDVGAVGRLGLTSEGALLRVPDFPDEPRISTQDLRSALGFHGFLAFPALMIESFAGWLSRGKSTGLWTKAGGSRISIQGAQ